MEKRPKPLQVNGSEHSTVRIVSGCFSFSCARDVHAGHRGLFPSDMEALAVALDAVRTRALADQMRTNDGPEVIELGP